MNFSTPRHAQQSAGGRGGPTGLLQVYLSCSRKERIQRFIDTRSAAELTGLSRRTIQWWIELGLIEAVRIGRRYQIDRSSLLSYLSTASS
jgi:excisionase family DNA binding protein